MGTPAEPSSAEEKPKPMPVGKVAPIPAAVLVSDAPGEEMTLARRMLRLRYVLILAFGALVSCADRLSADGAPIITLPLPESLEATGRSALSCFALTLGVLSVAVVYPTNIDSAATCRTYVLPLTLMTSAVSTSNVISCTFFRTHVNHACYLAHLALFVAVSIHSLVQIFVLGSRFTWVAARGVIVADGASLCLCALTLRAVGPPADGLYPPGNVPFHVAFAQGLYSVLLGSVLTSANRHRAIRSLASSWSSWGRFAHSVQREVGEDGHVADSAKMSECAASAESPLQRAMRRELALRFLRARLLLFLLPVFWFASSSTLRIWDGGGVARVSFQGVIVLATVFVLAASFPTDINTPAGRSLVLPPLVAVSAFGGLACWRSIPGTSDPLVAYASGTTNLIFTLLMMGATANCIVNAALCARGQYTWTTIRVFFAVDSVLFAFAVPLMRLHGPPAFPTSMPIYPPLQGSFVLSMARSGITLTAALALSAANRARIAAVAQKCGWNHVTLSLEHLKKRSAPDEPLHPPSAAASATPLGAACDRDAAAPSDDGMSHSHSGRHTRSMSLASEPLHASEPTRDAAAQ